MKKKWGWGAALLALTAALGGCRHASNSNAAQVRLIDAVPVQGPLSVSVAGETVWKHLSYGNSTGYQGIKPGAYQVEVSTDRQTTSKSISFVKTQRYTVLALNDPMPRHLSFRIFPDISNVSLPPGKALVYFINAAEVPSGVDLLINNIVAFPHDVYGHRSEPLLLGAGSYDVKVNPSDEVTSLVGPVILKLDPGHVYTLVAMGGRRIVVSLNVYPDDP
jgi:hypothetical protein